MLMIVFGVIILIIFGVCLPELMMIMMVGFIGYVLNKSINYQLIAKMCVVMTLFLCVEVIYTEIMPVINKAYDTKQSIVNEIDRAKGTIDRTKNLMNIEDDINKTKKQINDEKNKIDKYVEGVSDHPIWKFFTKYPGEDDK